ncbi:MAG: S8 family serine peptidase [Thermoplasmata archaeon]|nr:MAG: S8 family serine peptidase [Thermoplasmata archaeon]
MNLIRVIFTLLVTSFFILPTVLPVVIPASSANRNNPEFEFYFEIYRPDNGVSNRAESEPVPEEDQWYHRSALDLDRNGIFDSLERRAEVGVEHFDVILDYENEPTDEDIANLARLGFSSVSVYKIFKAVLVYNVPAIMLEELAALENVVMVEPRGYPTLYGDVQTPAVKARESEEYSPNTAWELGYSGSGVTVAIMDTGIDNNHPSFKGKWLGGVDFTKPDIRLTPRDGTYDADDTNGHGTTCAGIATGTGAPEGVYMGAAPEASLVDIRIGSTIGYAPGELFQDFYDAALEGAQWSIDHKDDQWAGASEELAGIHILSLSWGVDVDGSSDGSDVYSRALDRTVEAGIFTIVAAGNSGPDNDGFRGMGSGSLVITVGATDDQNTIIRDDDIIAQYSSRGPRKDNNDGYPYDELKPDISAPGTDIIQAQFDRTGDASSNGYGSRGSGTSYATPNVVGVVALMLEANPELDQKLIKEILRFTAERWDEPTFPELDPFWNKDFGWGIIDAYSAVKVAEELEDTSAIDIELQCHITNVTDNTIDANAAEAEFTGLAWARVGQVEALEVQWDEATSDEPIPLCTVWKRVAEFSDVEAGEFINWSFSVDMREMSKGEHTLYARAVGADGSHSLVFSQTFEVINPPPKKPSGLGASAGLFVAIILLIVITIIAWNYYKKRNR